MRRLLPHIQPEDVPGMLNLAYNLKPALATNISQAYTSCGTCLLDYVSVVLPAAAGSPMTDPRWHITRQDITELLLTAIIRKHQPMYLSHLCQLRSTNRLFLCEVTILLQWAVNTGYWQGIAPLCSLPPAITISNATAADLGFTAVRNRDPSTISQLRTHLSAAQQLDAACTAGFLHSTLSMYGTRGVGPELYLFTAAYQISSSALPAMISLASTHSKLSVVELLCELQSAAEITPGAVTELLLHTFAVCKDSDMADFIADQLCELEGAQHLQAWLASMLAAVMLAAVPLSAGLWPSLMVCQLCQLPAAQQLDAIAVEQLLRLSVQRVSDEIVLELCCSMPTHQIPAATLAELLQLVMRVGTPFRPAALLRLPAAQQLSADLVGQLLVTAVKVNQLMGCKCGRDECQADTVRRLSVLPGAEHLSSNTVTHLLQTAVQLEDDWALKTLCTPAGSTWAESK